MISSIIQMIQMKEWYGISDNVEIAKGKNQYIFTFKKLFKQFKRWLKK